MLINDVNIKYGDEIIYKNFNIEFEDNKINCIIGKSGCGKTTLLNFIGNKLVQKGIRVSYVFQNHSLIPWKNVYSNLKLIGKKSFDKKNLDKEIDNILECVELKEFKYYYPNELSGGMKQRVNLARALLGNFDVILMDEPFNSLDIKSKKEMISLIKKINIERKTTIILITHEKEEIFELAYKVFLLGDKPVKVIDEGYNKDFKNIINKML